MSKSKYYQKYKDDYHLEWPCVGKSTKGEYYAFCTVCGADISIKSGGRNDVFRHITSDKHKQTAKARGNTKGIQSFFRSAAGDDSATKAEALFTGFLVEHNLPVAASDHAGPIFKKMFPDSNIATKYGSARTKTSSMIHAMSKNTSALIAEEARNSVFSLATDGSNDGGSEQLYPVLLNYFDETKEKVVQALLSLPALTDGASTGENIFQLLNRELSKEKIPWSNCISFVADNASVMLGRHKGVAAFIQKEHSECYVVGCPCHMAHNTAEKASKALPIAIDELLIDIYYYLDKSSKRQKALKSLQILCDTGVRKILKHGATRWLSLGLCIDRLLSQWQPLQLFFKEEMKGSTMTRRPVSTKTGPLAEKTAKASSTPSTSMSAPKKGPSAEKTSKSSSTPNTSMSAPKKGPSAEKTSKSSSTPNTSMSAPKKGSAEKTSKSSSTTSTSMSAPKKGPSAEKTAKTSITSTSSLTATSKQYSSVSRTLKRKSSGPQGALPAKRPVLKAGTLTAPILQESRLVRVHRLLISPQTKLYCYFLKYSNKIFDDINLLLQREEPCIHILNKQLNKTFQDMLVRFVQPTVIVECSDVKKVQYGKRDCQKSDKDLMIGKDAKEYLESTTSPEDDSPLRLTDADLTYFYLSVRKYYESACDYALKTWPLDVKFLKEAEVIDVSSRRDVSFSSVQYFVEKYPCILNRQSENGDLDKLELEFAQYQVEDFSGEPEILNKNLRIDKKWSAISKMEDGNGSKKYTLLSKVMKSLLVIPHSNASCERVFSIVRKNKTDFRGSMNLKTLQALLTEKIANTDVPCYQREYSKDLLSKLKQATYQSLQGKPSSTPQSLPSTSTSPISQ
ncbi:uncharacterized protein LOC105439660 [Strongylocentrotus purpuratus]|uniref:HAT C-terminal dimerisation domain-containing protein n=1 Tax=Strongylocentrotus purpuratus TaxID=7668 RepID=A0A7M7PQL9_STRPU|nr:uncharacterized protein LOC105439660 [Strongylocentrotus purpuratus]